MGRVIPFYVPKRFKPKARREVPSEVDRIVEIHTPASEGYSQPTWIFPEVDADLVVGQE